MVAIAPSLASVSALGEIVDRQFIDVRKALLAWYKTIKICRTVDFLMLFSL